MDLIRDLQYRWRVARYGVDTVYPRRAHQLFIEIADADLAAQSFRIVQDRVVRTIDHDITQLVALQSLKGSSYCLIWGVSLSFIPHSWTAGARWHRTQKSARFDLYEAPAMASDLPISRFESITANGLHGAAFLQKDLRRVWQAERDQIIGWLDEVTTVEAVLKKARAQQAVMNSHSPPPAMIEAFALARLGHSAEGRSRLDALIDEYGESLEPSDALRSALEHVAESASQ